MSNPLAVGLLALLVLIIVATYFVFVLVAQFTPSEAPVLIDAIQDYNAEALP